MPNYIGWPRVVSTDPSATKERRETNTLGRKLMAVASSAPVERATASEATRWGQLIFGIICMVMIANLQYGWTLFVNPIDQKYHWGRAAIQVAFTIFVATETWLVPLEGYLIDKFGPRIDGVRIGRTGRNCVGAQLRREFACASLPRGRYRRHRCRRRSTAPASATRSNGFPTVAALRRASPRLDLARDRRSPSCRSPA